MATDMIIDFTAHSMPAEIEGLLALGAKHADNRLEDRLKLMDKYGVDIQVAHLSAAHLYGLNKDGSSKVCTTINDYIYNELVHKEPDKFIGCGALNLLDVDFSLNELDRVLDYGFKAVTVATHQENVALEDPKVFPLLEEITKRKLPLFIHPITWEKYPRAARGPLMQGLGWPFETSVTLWGLIADGIFDKLPNLRIVTHHLGGMFPYYRHRIEVRMERERGAQYKPLSAYKGQIFADTALDGGSLADLMVGYSLLGADGILFGTDWPFIDESRSVGANLSSIKAMPIPEEERSKILYHNAHKLLDLGH